MLKATRTKVYQTEFGPFRITTYEGKSKRRNGYTGKKEWVQIKDTGGVFEE